MDINKKQKLVYDVIQLSPGVQNNNAKLVAAVWRHEGWSDSLSLEENIIRVSRSETITRRCRELHVMGLIEYSAEADKAREEAFTHEVEAHHDYEQSKFF